MGPTWVALAFRNTASYAHPQYKKEFNNATLKMTTGSLLDTRTVNVTRHVT